MDSYSEKFRTITEMKQNIREYAIKHFNWMDRSQQINSIIMDSKIDNFRKEQGIKVAVNFEETRQGFIYRFAKKYPLLWDLYKKRKQF